jgi:hypothetical protein
MWVFILRGCVPIRKFFDENLKFLHKLFVQVFSASNVGTEKKVRDPDPQLDLERVVRKRDNIPVFRVVVMG